MPGKTAGAAAQYKKKIKTRWEPYWPVHVPKILFISFHFFANCSEYAVYTYVGPDECVVGFLKIIA